MITLVRTEIARALSRRLVRVTILLGVVMIALGGLLAFRATAEFDAAAQDRARIELEADVQECTTELSEAQCRTEIRFDDYDHSLPLTALWAAPDGNDDGDLLAFAIVLLAFGGILAAASLVGAEFRTGMLATLLTWEPRRVRVAVARVASAGLAATAIAFVLQVVFIAALLPAMLAHGGTEGADSEWLRGVLFGMARGSMLVGMAAMVGASIAFIGRHTALALGAAFVYLNLLEPVVRTWKPGLGRWLVGENASAFLVGDRADVVASRAPLAVLAAYACGLLALAAYTFRRRDLT